MWPLPSAAGSTPVAAQPVVKRRARRLHFDARRRRAGELVAMQGRPQKITCR